MKAKLLFAFFISITAFICNAQDSIRVKKNAAYFEFLGNGLVFSINYERLLYREDYFRLSGRIGISVNTNPIIPVELNALIGKKNHFLETGAGLTTISNKDLYLLLGGYENTELLFLRLGYRFQKSSGGFLFRAAPVLFYPIREQMYPSWFPWVGVSFGYTF